MTYTYIYSVKIIIKKALYVSDNVSGTKVLIIGDTIVTSPSGDGTAILWSCELSEGQCMYVPPWTPNWHPVLKKIFPKIDTPF